MFLRRRARGFVALTALAASSFAASSALAVQPNADLGSRPDFELFSGGDAQVHGAPRWDHPPRALVGPLSRFKNAFGADWRASFDDRTGVPSRLFGRGRSVPGSVANAAIAETAARDVLASHIELFAPGAAASDFELVSNDLDAGMRTLGFVQKRSGMRVLGGQVSFRFKNDRLFMIGSEAMPFVPTDLVLPSVDPAQAAKSAEDWIDADFGLATAGAVGDPVVLPVPGARGRRYVVAVPVEVTPNLVTAKYRVYVDATTYEPIARQQLLHFAEANVELFVPQRAPAYGERFNAPAALTIVTVDAGNTKTSASGTVTWNTAVPASIELFLIGDRARVFNDAGEEDTLVTQLTDATPFLWDASAQPTIDAQLTTFAHANAVREFAKSFAPQFGFLNQQVRATVNIDDVCNAFSDGTEINFFAAGQGCENTGRIADVVYHEYGHSIHAHAIIEGVGAFEGALSEGVSDYLAATITGDPATARGFFGDDEELRHIDPPQDAVWPDDLFGEVHYDGLIIAGTLWDLRKRLIDDLGEAEGILKANELYFQGIRRAINMPTMYPEVLAADDDDGDLTNGTPNVCAINEVFAAHGLRASTASAKGPTLGVVPPTQDGYDIAVQVSGLFPQCDGDQILGGTLRFHDRASAANPTELELDIEGETLSATIPKQPANTVVNYQVEIQLDGRTIRFPDNEADPEYEMFVGDVTEIYCTDFEKNPEDEGWTHGLQSGEPNEGADDWSWGRAKGDQTNGDAPEAFSGQLVYGNDISLESNYNGLYQPEIVNWTTTPAIDLKGATNVHLQYRRWLNVEDGHFDQATIYAGDFNSDTLLWTNFDSDNGDNSSTQHTDREWRFHDVDVSDAIAADGTVQLTFKLTTDAGLQLGGWTLDDVCLVSLGGEVPCDPAQGGCGEGGGNEGGAGGAGGGPIDDDGSDDPADDDGCDCAVPRPSTSGRAWLALAALLPLLRRRNRKR